MSGSAFVFPGQGSQRLGMFAQEGVLPEVLAAVATASEVLGSDLLAASADQEAIDDTRNIQPIMLAAGVGTYNAWRKAGGEPQAMAGHSLGEYSALVCAGVMDYRDAVDVVACRAAAMSEAAQAGAGAMCAVLGLDLEAVQAACEGFAGSAWVANVNSPGQTVVACRAEAVEALQEKCKSLGAKRSVRLPVNIASHCPLMEPAGEALKTRLQSCELREPQVPVLQNATSSFASSVDEIKSNLVAQLTARVDWIACVNVLAGQGLRLVECGPSGVLHGLNRRIVDADRCAKIDTAESISALQEA